VLVTFGGALAIDDDLLGRATPPLLVGVSLLVLNAAVLGAALFFGAVRHLRKVGKSAPQQPSQLGTERMALDAHELLTCLGPGTYRNVTQSRCPLGLLVIQEREPKEWRKGLSATEAAVVDRVMGLLQKGQPVGGAQSPLATGHAPSHHASGQGVELTQFVGAAVASDARSPSRGSGGGGDSGRGSTAMTTAELTLEACLLRPEDVVLVKRVGSGAFGEVFEGTCAGVGPVAVKALRRCAHAEGRF
jgi:hypothetical protein